MNNNPLLIAFGCLIFLTEVCAQKIDRKSLVRRHNVINTKIDTLSSLTVGNGKFAFTVDATGLQSFPEHYANGVPLGTQSDWAWHSFPNKENLQYSETLKTYRFEGQPEGLYASQGKTARQLSAFNYFRENPHRLQMGNIGFEILKKDGSLAEPKDLQNINQKLDLWTGEISSHFTIEGIPVHVVTCSHGIRDVIAVKLSSALVNENRIKIKVRFPYPTNQFSDFGINYSNDTAHQTHVNQSSSNDVIFSRLLDADRYFLSATWKGKAKLEKKSTHYYTILPQKSPSFEISFSFTRAKSNSVSPSFNQTAESSKNAWIHYWQSGGAIDLSGSKDLRAKELERRIILSQYLLRVQEAGNHPPQETGLTYNSWYGRPHMEMLWWHTTQYALWGRSDLMEKSMAWYFRAYKGAQEIARRQGYAGVRWQKMTDNHGGDSPSNIGSFLIWQQPNIIYQAELLYREKPSKELLNKYSKLISATADFMASFARYKDRTGFFDLGKGIIPAQEHYNPAETFNSPYELAYWKWALQIAQKWRERQGLPLDKNWQKVIDKLAPLPQVDGVYTGAENVKDAYSPSSKFRADHPAVLMAYGLLPANGTVDTVIMKKTFDLVNKVWD